MFTWQNLSQLERDKLFTEILWRQLTSKVLENTGLNEVTSLECTQNPNYLHICII